MKGQLGVFHLIVVRREDEVGQDGWGQLQVLLSALDRG